jgi:hypothetical protein
VPRGRSDVHQSLNRTRPLDCTNLFVIVASLASGCAGWPDGAPETNAVLHNSYPASAAKPLVIYDAYWQVSFSGNPIPPGSSSAPQQVAPTSGDTAYVVLAPGWSPSSCVPPTSFIVLESRSTFAVALGDTLDIPVDDAAFEGNCVAGNALTQEQADFLTHIVFADDFAGFTYDASTCTTTKVGDAGASRDPCAD